MRCARTARQHYGWWIHFVITQSSWSSPHDKLVSKCHRKKVVSNEADYQRRTALYSVTQVHTNEKLIQINRITNQLLCQCLRQCIPRNRLHCGWLGQYGKLWAERHGFDSRQVLEYFSSSEHPDWLWTPPASRPMDTSGPFCEGKAARAWT